jgi:hypothetical protein
MGRKLKRVPLDFDYQIDCGWDGYCPSIEIFQKLFGDEYKFLYNYTDNVDICQKCKENCGDCAEDAEYCFWHNPDNKALWYKEVPSGEGYQLWATTTEGCPITPVFKTLEELCKYCEKEKVTVWADETLTKEQWFDALREKGS